MPKVRIITKYEPEDSLVHFAKLKWNAPCSKCKTQLKQGQPAYWSPKENVIYCPACKKHRVSDEGIAKAMAERLLKL